MSRLWVFAFAAALSCVACLPLFARKIKKGSYPQLCSIHSAYVDGNSESADAIRQQLANKTWMEPAPSSATAGAIIRVSEARSEKRFPLPAERTTVSLIISTHGKDVWFDSVGFNELPFSSGARFAAKVLLADVKKAAACGK